MEATQGVHTVWTDVLGWKLLHGHRPVTCFQEAEALWPPLVCWGLCVPVLLDRNPFLHTHTQTQNPTNTKTKHTHIYTHNHHKTKPKHTHTDMASEALILCVWGPCWDCLSLWQTPDLSYVGTDWYSSWSPRERMWLGRTAPVTAAGKCGERRATPHVISISLWLSVGP